MNKKHILPHCSPLAMNVPHSFLQETLAYLFNKSCIFTTYAHSDSYNAPEHFLHLPYDKKIQETCNALAYQKKKLDPQMILLVGIGGSNLGALAIYEALKQTSTVPLHCIDALDSDTLEQTIALTEGFLKNKQTVLLVLITKSGKTTETIAHASIFIELLKMYRPHDYTDTMVFISDNNSPLWQLANKLDCSKLPIPLSIGGRYSVFSAVGLFPLALANINIDELCLGAQQASNMLSEISHSAAVRAACIWYHYHHNDMLVHDTFIFDKALLSYGYWYRQLIAESLGKQTNGVRKGILPTISLGTTDLHSTIQLYLAGPRIRTTTFICPPTKNCITINSSVLPTYNGLRIDQLNECVYNGVYQTYIQQEIPCMAWTQIEKTPYSLGFLMQTNMLEALYLAFLMKINAFDQPAVEMYKTQTHLFLDNLKRDL